MIIAIPIAIPIVLVVSVLGILFGYKELDSSREYNKPLLQDKKAFLQAQPYFCDDCKTFTDVFQELCESCGAKNCLRKATSQDFMKHIYQKKLHGK
ncbi:MAG: hypothetical protein ACXACX_10235 [Candidatus Hodarchaeales archaeon]